MALMSLFHSDMATPCTLSSYIGQNEETNIEEYEDRIIYCRVWGSCRYKRTPEGSKKVSSQKYITVDEVKVGDKIDGQYVQVVDIIYDFDGSVLHYEAQV